MKNKYFSLAIINIARRKKLVFMNVLIICISLLILLLTSTASVSIDNYLNKYLLNTLNYRTLHISTFKLQKGQKEAIQNVVMKDSRIVDFYEENFGIYVKVKDANKLKLSEGDKSDRFFGSLSLYAFTEAYKDYIVAGEPIKDGSTNVGIIPKQFFPCGSFQIGYWQEKNEFIDGESLIGEIITVEYYARDYNTDKMEVINTFSYSFKVIGVYDILLNNNYPYDVFLPFEDVQSMINDVDENNLGLSEDYNMTYTVVVDDQRHVNEVIGELLNAGFIAKPKAELGPFVEIVRHIIVSGHILGMIILFVGFVNIGLTMIKAIENRIGEIGLMKAIGYRDIHLVFIVGMEAIIIGCISYLVSVTLYIVTLITLNQIMPNSASMYMQQLMFQINYLQIIRNILLGIAIPLISSIFSVMSILKISPMNALNKGGQ